MFVPLRLGLGIALSLASSKGPAAVDPAQAPSSPASTRAYRGVDAVVASETTAGQDHVEVEQDRENGGDEVLKETEDHYVGWGEEDGEEGWDDDYEDSRDSPEAREARQKVAGAVALIVVGSSAVLGGLAMGLSDPCRRAAGNSCSTSARNRAALTMALPGVAVLATGAVILGLGLRERRRVQADVAVSTEGAGLRIRGRF